MENQYSYYNPENQNENTKFTGGSDFNQPHYEKKPKKKMLHHPVYP